MTENEPIKTILTYGDDVTKRDWHIEEDRSSWGSRHWVIFSLLTLIIGIFLGMQIYPLLYPDIHVVSTIRFDDEGTKVHYDDETDTLIFEP